MTVSFSITPNGTIYLWNDETNKIIYVAENVEELKALNTAISQLVAETEQNYRIEHTLDAIDTVCLNCPADESTCAVCPVRKLVDHYNKNRP